MFTTRQLLGRSDVLKRLASHPRFAPCHGKSEWDPGQTGDMAMENGSSIIFMLKYDEYMCIYIYVMMMTMTMMMMMMMCHINSGYFP